MGRFVSTISVAAALVVAAGACKKDDEGKKGNEDDKGPSASKTTTPSNEKPVDKTPPLTADRQLEIFDRCWELWGEQNMKSFASCYAPDGTIEMVDSVPPMQGSGDEALKIVEQFWTAFPDIEAHIAFVAADGKEKVAAFLTLKGTNEGSLMGMPATGKKVAMWAAQHVTMNPDGKVASDRHWSDGGTLMAQLGISPNPMAPAADSIEHPTETIRVTTKGDETEKNNLALLEKLDEPMKNQDVEAMVAAYADDAEFRYSAAAEVSKGHEALTKGLTEWFGMHESMETTTEDVWAAGDWVIAETTVKGTMAGNMPGIEVETKGKSYESRYLEFFQLADGKITKHYIFTDSSKWAADLGIFDPEKMMGGDAAEGGAAAGDEAQPKKAAEEAQPKKMKVMEMKKK